MDLGRFGAAVTDEMKGELARLRKDINGGRADLLILD
jgi:hypothetical protein